MIWPPSNLSPIFNKDQLCGSIWAWPCGRISCHMIHDDEKSDAKHKENHAIQTISKQQVTKNERPTQGQEGEEYCSSQKTNGWRK